MVRRFDEIGQRRDIQRIEQTLLRCTRRVQQRAGKTRVGHQRNETGTEAFIGENYAQNLDAARNRLQGLNALHPPGVPDEADLDVIRTCVSHLTDRGRKRDRLHRDCARDRTHRAPAVHRGDGRAPDLRRNGGEGPIGGTQIDDVGAMRNRDLGFTRTAHAGEHQGHRFNSTHSAIVLDIGVTLVVFRRAFERTAAPARTPVHHILDLPRQFKILIRDALGRVVLQAHLDGRV